MKKIPVRQITADLKAPVAAERFKIRTVEAILAGNVLKQDLHRHDFFFILLLDKAAGQHEIDFIPYEVVNHSVFFLRPGQVHQLELKAECTGYLLEFNNEFYHPTEKAASQRLRKASNKNYCELEMNRFQKLHTILTQIFNEYTGQEEGYRDIVKASLEIFFIELVRQSRDPNIYPTNISSYTHERFEELVGLLRSNISQHTSRLPNTRR